MGASVADSERLSDRINWTRVRENARRPTGPKCWMRTFCDEIVGGERALRLVVAADAEIVAREPAHVVAEPQRLIERQRIIQLAVDVNRLSRGDLTFNARDSVPVGSAALRFGVS